MWNARRPPRPEVRVTVGAKTPSHLGASALLDFAVDMTLDGEPMTRAEMQSILRDTNGLVLVKGRWVETPSALFAKTALTHAAKTPRARTLPENVLADVFGIEMVTEHVETRVQVKKRRRAR